MKTALIGSTGFVGANLMQMASFETAVHRPDVESLRGRKVELVVCAGLPAEKWIAATDPWEDFRNMGQLAGILDTMEIDTVVHISTVDVFQPPIEVTEDSRPHLDGLHPYGRNRAWFERFILQRFPSVVLVRLPALFGPGLKKNFLFDLLEGREDLYSSVNRKSEFQFWDIRETWNLIDLALDEGLSVLNVATEPITAEAIAGLFGVKLRDEGDAVRYDMRTNHAALFGGSGGYLRSSDWEMARISDLIKQW